jgi:hypothetical protein
MKGLAQVQVKAQCHIVPDNSKKKQLIRKKSDFFKKLVVPTQEGTH